MKKDRDDWIASARPPVPSIELRERVLAAARVVAPRPERGLVDRAWESRGVRWAWALLVSALLAGHAVVSKTGGRDGVAAPARRDSTPDLRAYEAALFPSRAWLQPQPPASRASATERLDSAFVRSLLEEMQ